MLNLFTRRIREEARRAALVEVLESQIGESVRRRRDGTTDVKSLMAQLQAGDQGDSQLRARQAAYADQTRSADNALARWGAMTPEAWEERKTW